MRFLEYGCYEDTEAFMIDEGILDAFKSVYEELDKGYRTLNYELEVSNVIKADTLNVKEWLEYEGTEWMNLEGNESMLEYIKILCEYYNVDSFWFNSVDIIKGVEKK